jgi:hypothetical protein
MTERVCLLNNRVCCCDPEATDEEARPCALSRRIGKLVRRMGSNFEGEVIAAATALRRVQEAEGFTFNVLANVIESIEERKYSDKDAKIIFMRGEEKGRREESDKQQAPPEFYDVDGSPRWYEIAVFCKDNKDRLRSEWERNFVTDDFIGGIIKFGKPTERQVPYLMGIFVKLGGYFDPKAVNLRR